MTRSLVACLALVSLLACRETRQDPSPTADQKQAPAAQPSGQPAAPPAGEDLPPKPAPEEPSAFEACVNRWLAERNLNEYGDPEGTMYAGGTPLFDETTGERTDRLDYVFRKHPKAREECLALVGDAGGPAPTPQE